MNIWKRAAQTKPCPKLIIIVSFFKIVLPLRQFYYLSKEHTYPGSLKIDLYLGFFEEQNYKLNSTKSYSTWSCIAVALLFCLGLIFQFTSTNIELIVNFSCSWAKIDWPQVPGSLKIDLCLGLFEGTKLRTELDQDIVYRGYLVFNSSRYLLSFNLKAVLFFDAKFITCLFLRAKRDWPQVK